MKTPESLLRRIRDIRDQEAWARFVDLYFPLLCYWARQTSMLAEDVSDFAQEVFCHLVQKLPTFQYDSERGSFRRWLHTVALNQWRQRHRNAGVSFADAGAAVENVPDVDHLSRFIDEEHNRYLVTRSLQLMRADFETSTWQACWKVIVEEKTVAEVAEELNMSPGAVYVAKSRVLQRLRQELEGLL